MAGTGRWTGSAPALRLARLLRGVAGRRAVRPLLVAPAGDVRRVTRRYRPGTLALETEFETEDGVGLQARSGGGALARRATDHEVSASRVGATKFLDRKFPICSVIRPSHSEAAAVGAVEALAAMGLFKGQLPEFFASVKALAEAADAARRQ